MYLWDNFIGTHLYSYRKWLPLPIQNCYISYLWNIMYQSGPPRETEPVGHIFNSMYTHTHTHTHTHSLCFSLSLPFPPFSTPCLPGSVYLFLLSLLPSLPPSILLSLSLFHFITRDWFVQFWGWLVKYEIRRASVKLSRRS